jgi:hypothetical protein
MRSLSALVVGSLLFGALGACTFSPGTPTGITGGGATTGLGTGNGGISGGGLRGGSIGSGTGANTGSGNIGPTEDANCGQSTFGAMNLPGDVLIVLDKSGSMANDFNDMNNCNGAMCKWPTMVSALNQVVMQTQASVNWGLKFFPTTTGCNVNNGVQVPIAANNATAIANALAPPTGPGGNTPTRAGVNNAVTFLQGQTSQNPKYILLATDGQPNCLNNNAGTTDDQGAINAVGAAFAAGIPVFVVGVGNVTASMNTLNSMAMMGGRAQPADAMGRVYFPADNPAQLVSQLMTISGQITSCTFQLASVPPVPDNILVKGDGQVIPKDNTNGWSYGPGMMSVVLNGTFCDMVKSKAITNVETIFGCAGVPIIP